MRYVDYDVHGSRKGIVRLFADYTYRFKSHSSSQKAASDEIGVWTTHWGDLKLFDHWLNTEDNGNTYYSYQVKMTRRGGTWNATFQNSHPNLVAASKMAYAAARLNSRNDELLQRMPVHAVAAEFGVQAGMYSQFIATVNPPRELHLVDVWEAVETPWPSFEEQKRNYENVLRLFASEIAAGKVIVHKGDDLAYMERIADHYFDWVYIDTTHQYEHTLRELELAARKVKPNGFICGHDYTDNVHSRKWGFGVMRAVNEFTRKQDWSIAFITNDVPNSYILQRKIR